MEQWRLFVAILLSILVFIVWEFFSPKPEAPLSPQADQPAQSRPADGGEAGGQEGDPGTSTARETSQPAPAGAEAVPDEQFQSVTIKTPLYTAEISQKGAAITSFTLHEYKSDMGENSGPKQLINPGNPSGTSLVHLAKSDPDLWFTGRYTTDFKESSLTIDKGVKSLSFYWRSPRGLVLEKRYKFFPDSYRIGLDVVIKNLSKETLSDSLTLTMQQTIPEERSRFAFEGASVYVNGELEQIDIGDISEQPPITGNFEWAGLSDRYFMTTLVPESGEEGKVAFAQSPDRELMSVSFVQPPHDLVPQMQDIYTYYLYMGPKRLSILRQYEDSLAKAINFGFFDIIAKPCLWLMNAIHDHLIANYGVAIILLTILFKIIFWPLGTKSYKSMAEMKKLQPLMSDIRKKYKNDKKKMNEEVMRLYRTYKVNPMSGCLPMLVQIPVFIAFYRMLYEAIELRHAPFLLWINDLSAPDRLFRFDVQIPLMLPPYGIPVLTLIMGATMFLQQKLSPPPGDPSQAKIMMMLPIVFTFIFINFPSGLVLYWLVNNVISIGQQYYITKKTV
jgi:YidC/Oxa1 family membrane protein insertase